MTPAPSFPLRDSELARISSAGPRLGASIQGQQIVLGYLDQRGVEVRAWVLERVGGADLGLAPCLIHHPGPRNFATRSITSGRSRP
jgi:hypothetical protein